MVIISGINQRQRTILIKAETSTPFNLPDGSPGNGYGTFKIKESKFNITVVNLMGNYSLKNVKIYLKLLKK